MKQGLYMPSGSNAAGRTLDCFVPVDVRNELIPLDEVPRYRPRGRNGKRLHRSVGYRWTSRGLRGVKLRYVQAGGVRCTTLAWLEEFDQALTALNTSPADQLSAAAQAGPSVSVAMAEAQAAQVRLNERVFDKSRRRFGNCK